LRPVKLSPGLAAKVRYQAVRAATSEDMVEISVGDTDVNFAAEDVLAVTMGTKPFGSSISINGLTLRTTS
jgi:hypothetical protein